MAWRGRFAYGFDGRDRMVSAFRSVHPEDLNAPNVNFLGQ
jgi:hypothetical protein